MPKALSTVGDRQRFCQAQRVVLAEQFSSREHDAFLFAEVERDLISERTREGLAKAKASGRKLGRPKGSLGVSRLDGKENEIRHFLELGVSKTAIAKITGVSRTTLYSFMTTRGLRPSR